MPSMLHSLKLITQTCLTKSLACKLLTLIVHPVQWDLLLGPNPKPELLLWREGHRVLPNLSLGSITL